MLHFLKPGFSSYLEIVQAFDFRKHTTFAVPAGLLRTVVSYSSDVATVEYK